MTRLDDRGLIPAGHACPFLDECGLRMERCPDGSDNARGPFSCAAARAFVMLERLKREKSKR